MTALKPITSEQTHTKGFDALEELHAPIFMKHKSYTPIPNKRTHAKSYHEDSRGNSVNKKPFILGVSSDYHLVFIDLI